jgi:chromosome segregation ATPase
MSNLDKFIFFKIESYKTYLLRKNISESTINNIINNSINIIEDLDNLIPATNYSKYMLINKLLIDEEKIKKRMKDLTNININIMQKINENNNKIYYILQCVDKIEDKELEENKLDNLLNNLNQSNEYKKLKINELNKELEVNQSTIDDLVKILDNLNEENDDLIKSIEEKELYMYERKEIINNEINNLVKEMENLIEEILQFKLKISV